MPARTKVADVDELPADGSRVIAEVRGQEVAVFRHRGEFYALANYCVHQSGPLCEGGLTGYADVADDMWDWEYDPEEKYLSCPWHGWVFDITTGTNAKDDAYAVPTYEVEVEDGEVFVRR
jgi:nitrite reductase/ring-hydroxylating ferredoxin subunit